MGYATPLDLVPLLPERELLQLADDSPDRSGTLESPAVQAVLAEAVDQASREIDAYVSASPKGPAVPLDPVPPLVANIAAKLAVCTLFTRAGQRSDIWEAEGERLRRLLEHIAAGKLNLGAPAEDQAAPAEPASGITVAAPARQFGPGTWEKF